MKASSLFSIAENIKLASKIINQMEIHSFFSCALVSNLERVLLFSGKVDRRYAGFRKVLKETLKSSQYRSSYQKFHEKIIPQNFAKFSGKRMLQFLLNNGAGLKLVALLKKRARHRCSLLNFSKCFRTYFNRTLNS